MIYIGAEDRERTADLTTTKDIWVSLWKKYKNKLKTTDPQYIEDWATYKKSPEKSIEETLTDISTLAREIKVTQPSYESLTTESARIQPRIRLLLGPLLLVLLHRLVMWIWLLYSLRIQLLLGPLLLMLHLRLALWIRPHVPQR